MIEKKPNPLLQKIFDLRKAKKINLAQLGEVMGVKRPTAGKIENGDIPLPSDRIPAIAKLLGVKIWELFSGYQKPGLGELSEEEAKLVLTYRKIKNEKD